MMGWFQFWWVMVPPCTAYAWWQIGTLADRFPESADPRFWVMARGLGAAVMGLIWPLMVPRMILHLLRLK